MAAEPKWLGLEPTDRARVGRLILRVNQFNAREWLVQCEDPHSGTRSVVVHWCSLDEVGDRTLEFCRAIAAHDPLLRSLLERSAVATTEEPA